MKNPENPVEMTPNEAAEFLNVSRTFVMKLLDTGVLPFRTVESYHRVLYADLATYRTAQRAHARKALDEMHEIERDLGLDDINPSPEEVPLVRGSGRS